MSTIHTRFDLICGSSKDADRELCRAEMVEIPAPGETISLKGNPYVVVSRGWSVEHLSGTVPSMLRPGKQYAYVRVSKLYPFDESVNSDSDQEGA